MPTRILPARLIARAEYVRHPRAGGGPAPAPLLSAGAGSGLNRGPNAPGSATLGSRLRGDDAIYPPGFRVSYADHFRPDIPHRRAGFARPGGRADRRGEQGRAGRAQRRREIDFAGPDPRRAAGGGGGGARRRRPAEIEARIVEIDAHPAPSRAARILAGLGLDEAMQHRPVAGLSGGWRMRVALAAILFAEPDLLLLDEPTNHLDLEAALWLERFLRSYRRTLILVSHDRRFLNAVTTVTLHLQHGKLTAYSGGFDAYLRARTEAARRLESLARQQSFERQRMQAFVARFRYKASKARQAQSRLKALARLEPIVLPAGGAPARIPFPDPTQLTPPLIALEGAAVGYVQGKPVLSRLDLRLDPNDRSAGLAPHREGEY